MPATREGRRPPRLAGPPDERVDELDDDADISDAVVTGDHSARQFSSLELYRCHVESARFAGATFERLRMVDCTLRDCDLAGIIVDEGSLTRVEIRDSRLSGLQCIGARFADVAMTDCRIDDANLRMTMWERSELIGCVLRSADLYGADLKGARIESCDLRQVELSKANLTRAVLNGSNLDDIVGGDSLRGVTIASDQIVPLAMAVFRSFGVTIDDEALADEGGSVSPR